MVLDRVLLPTLAWVVRGIVQLIITLCLEFIRGVPTVGAWASLSAVTDLRNFLVILYVCGFHVFLKATKHTFLRTH